MKSWLLVPLFMCLAFAMPSTSLAASGAPVITQQPDLGLVAGPGYVTEFSAAATGNPAPTVRWQVAPDRDGPWTDVSGNPGETTNTLVVSASSSNLGDAYRAVFTNSAGAAISRPAKLVSRMDWMGNLGNDIADVPLNELTIPGTHDMGTYGITANSGISLDGQVSDLACTIQSVCVSYARAQDPSNTAAEELNDGIRYFDLRACGDGSVGEPDVPLYWYDFTVDPMACHGLDGAGIAEILSDTRNFVLAHPTEVVVLDFNHEFQLDEFRLAQEIEQAFALPGGGSLLIPPSKCTLNTLFPGECPSQLTLRQIWQGKLGNVIVNVENDGAPGQEQDTDFEGEDQVFNIQPLPGYVFNEENPQLWGTLGAAPDSSEFCTKGIATVSCFGNNSDRYDVLARVENTLSTRQTFTDTRQFFIQFLQTTPDGSYIGHNLDGSLLDMAVAPDIGSNPIIGPALFDCGSGEGTCFAAVRPENMNILAINFYDRTHFPTVDIPLTLDEIHGCVDGNGTCDLTSDQQSTVFCITVNNPDPVRECFYTKSVDFDLIDQSIRFDEYARTAPVVNISAPVTPSATGWYNASSGLLGGQLGVGVTASDYWYPTGLTALSCTDNGSPISLTGGLATSASSTIGLAFLSDGSHSLACQATDGANQGFNGVGNSGAGPGSTSPVVFKVDTHAPTAAPTQAPSANGAGWNHSDVAVTWNWTDPAGGSGVDPAHCTTSSTSSGEGASITLSATCSDLAGNTGSGSYVVKVDKTPPTVIYSGNAGSYSLLAPVAITCNPSDTLSGIASSTCANTSGAAWTFGAGVHKLSASATDVAGNTGAGSAAFTVTVSSADLCTLTRQFVDGGAKYIALSARAKVVVDADVTTGCKLLTSILPKLSASQKQPLVAAYRKAVQVLAQAGWLTSSQASTLSNLVGVL